MRGINEQTLATPTPMKGRCVCGAVQYEVTGNPIAFDLGHCSRCRESSGSAFIAELVIKPAWFEWNSRQSLAQTARHPSARNRQGIVGHSAQYAVDQSPSWTGT
jgi:hypothetical protein